MNNSLNRTNYRGTSAFLTFRFEHILGNLIVLCHTALGILDAETGNPAI